MGPLQREIARDAAAHRQPDEVRALRRKVIQHALEVAPQIGEVERPGVILGIAVAPRVPGGGAVADRRRSFRLSGYSALAPEIFTARARLALSVLRKASKPSGELPTTS